MRSLSDWIAGPATSETEVGSEDVQLAPAAMRTTGIPLLYASASERTLPSAVCKLPPTTPAIAAGPADVGWIVTSSPAVVNHPCCSG